MCTQSVSPGEEIPSFYGSPIPESQLCQSCRLKIPQKDDNMADLGQFEITTIKTESTFSNRTFVSTQFPSDRDIYSSLRQIIMRVFTVETTVDLTKPLMFGDTKQGYTLAVFFKLQDKTARGAERKYALLVTSDKEADLLNNYTFTLANLLKMVDKITSKAREVAAKENSAADDGEINNNDIYLRRSSNLPKAKSMVDILNDENLFTKIHLWAAFLLDKIEDD